jgi:ribosomal protein S18 acetylase RimI-like enzyme
VSAVELRSLEREHLARVVECQQDAFSDYPVPAVLDEVGLSVYLRETGVALERSWGAYSDAEMVAFCLGAVRGSEGSIRGEGTAIAHRRRGIGGQVLERTLESLREAGARSVGLEVLEQNLPAIALYERHGFERRRKLLGWSLRRKSLRRPDQATAIAPAEAVRRLGAWGWPEAPWQLQLETLKQLPAYALGDDTVAVAKLRGRKMWLYALAVDPTSRRRGRASALIRSLPATRISVPALMPEEWEAGTALLRSLGSRLDPLAQWEMTRE